MMNPDFQRIVTKYVNRWNDDKTKAPLWVVGASPGDYINIPGVTFGTATEPRAGMETYVNAHVIVLNAAMVPDSLISTFLHEYGHALYRASHPTPFDEVAAEVAAMRFSLQSLCDEGLEQLAIREARAIKAMAVAEPYKSALATLANHAIRKKCGGGD